MVDIDGISAEFRISITEEQEEGVDYELTRRDVSTRGEYRLYFTPTTSAIKRLS